MAPLPTGYYFRPSRIDLIDYYLKRKINGLPLPDPSHPLIIEDDIYRDHPRNMMAEAKRRAALAGESSEEYDSEGAYFYTTLRSSTENGKKNKSRTVGNWGTWKQVRPEDVKVDSEVIGYYKYFKFLPDEGTSGAKKEEWQMHEYSILGNTDFVLCHLVNKSSKKAKKGKSKIIKYRTPSDLGAGTSENSCVLETNQQITKAPQTQSDNNGASTSKRSCVNVVSAPGYSSVTSKNSLTGDYLEQDNVCYKPDFQQQLSRSNVVDSKKQVSNKDGVFSDELINLMSSGCERRQLYGTGAAIHRFPITGRSSGGTGLYSKPCHGRGSYRH